MNPGIFYLYEYNNMQKLRNVGFLKLTRYYHSCTLQLNARGIPVTYADTLKFCAFYLENDTVGATVLAEIPCTNHMVSARLNFAECQFPDGHTLNTMDGFFLPLSNGRILAAAVPGILVDTKKLLSVFETPPAAKTPSENTKGVSKAKETVPNNGEAVSENPDLKTDQKKPVPEITDENPEHEASAAPDMPDGKPEHETSAAPDLPDERHEHETSAAPNLPDERHEHETSAAPDMPDERHEHETSAAPDLPDERHEHETSAAPDMETPGLQMQNVIPDCDETASQEREVTPNCDESVPQAQDTVPCVKENAPGKGNSGTSLDIPQQTARKIQRADMSALPRCYWHLANNSFLLHGYHNYNHLLLVEKDGHYWLGVPGIYDSHEARAARLFGFPQFTDSYNEQLQLSDDEQNSQGTFGYWCCYLK